MANIFNNRFLDRFAIKWRSKVGPYASYPNLQIQRQLEVMDYTLLEGNIIIHTQILNPNSFISLKSDCQIIPSILTMLNFYLATKIYNWHLVVHLPFLILKFLLLR